MSKRLLPLLFVMGCAADPAENSCHPRTAAPIDPAATDHVFLVDTVQLSSLDQNGARHVFGLDLDGDAAQRRDNAFGYILATVFGDDIDTNIQTLLDTGVLVQVINLRATDLTDAAAIGIDVHPDGHPLGAPLTGSIHGGRVFADVGDATIGVSFPGLDRPFLLPLTGARLEGTLDGDRLTGDFGGVIRIELIDAYLMPAIFEGVTKTVASDCPDGTCPEDSLGATFVLLFDEDKDGAITLAEVRDNDLLHALLSADVDLFDANGLYAPRCDGQRDGLSVGARFTATLSRN